MKFRWKRSDEGWFLYRWVNDADLNIRYWDWTGYSVSGKDGACYIEVPELKGFRSEMSIREAKAEVKKQAKGA